MRISDWSADVCSSDLHAVRTLHSCARALDVLGSRGTVRLHGACVGSGVEVAAAAHRRIAAADSWFQLAAVRMGLIAGADRKSAVQGQSVSVRVDLGGSRNIKKKHKAPMTGTGK